MQQIITNDPSSCEYAKRAISYFVQQLVLVQPAVNWVDRLNAAIGVSTALDEREQPACQTFRLERTTAAGIRTDDVHRHPGLKRKWKERKHSLDSIWLIRREGERGRLKEEGTERDPLIEASRPADRLTMLDCVNATHCSCPSNSATGLQVAFEDRLVHGREMFNNHNDKQYRQPFCKSQRAWLTGSDRIFVEGARLRSLPRKALTFRASWSNAR